MQCCDGKFDCINQELSEMEMFPYRVSGIAIFTGCASSTFKALYKIQMFSYWTILLLMRSCLTSASKGINESGLSWMYLS